MLASILLSLLASMIVGGILLAVGIRGRRLNDHPTCRDCGFDLENVYPASSTCPECGSGLKRPKAVRTGQRRRRPVFIAAGLMLLLTPLAPIGVVGFASITGQDINQYKPLSLLLWESRHADARTGKAIAAELMTRMLGGKLSAPQKDRIVEMVLARQEDIDLPWDDAWGDLIDRAKLDGSLSADQQQRFLRNAVIPKLKARARIAVGGPIPLAIETEVRASSMTSAYASVWEISSTLNGSPIKRTAESRVTNMFAVYAEGEGTPLGQTFVSGARSRSAWARIQNPPTVISFTSPPDAKPGAADLKLEVFIQTLQWDVYGSTRNIANQRPKADDPEVRRWVLNAPVTVSTDEAGVIERVPASEDLAGKLAKRLRPSQTTFEPGGFFTARTLNLTFSITDLPVPICFDVFWRTPDKSELLGTLSSGSSALRRDNPYYYYGNAQPGSRTVFGNASKFKGYKLDLVLKPRLDLAVETIDLTSVYCGEVVIKDVELVNSVGLPFKKPAKDSNDTKKNEAAGEEPPKDDAKRGEPAPPEADPKR